MERASLDLLKSQDFLSNFQRENEALKQEIVSLEIQLKQKNEDIVSFDNSLKENLRLYDEKMRDFEGLEEKFLLINMENERLIGLFKDYELQMQGITRDFISKQEIQAEIDEIMRKFLRERELFEAQLEHLVDENKGLLKESEENKRMNENYMRLLEEKENYMRLLEEKEKNKENSERYNLLSAENKRLIDLLDEKERKMLEEKDFYKKIYDEKEKFHEIDLLQEKISLITNENKRLLSLIEEKDNKITEVQKDKELYLKRIDDNREIIEDLKRKSNNAEEVQSLQVKILLINTENERLFEIIEEKETEIEELIKQRKIQAPKFENVSSVPEETARLYKEIDKLREENARMKVLSEVKSSHVLQETRDFKENIRGSNEYVKN